MYYLAPKQFVLLFCGAFRFFWKIAGGPVASLYIFLLSLVGPLAANFPLVATLGFQKRLPYWRTLIFESSAKQLTKFGSHVWGTSVPSALGPSLARFALVRPQIERIVAQLRLPKDLLLPSKHSGHQCQDIMS